MEKNVTKLNLNNGLPLESLISAPLEAAINAQLVITGTTAEFLSVVGFKDSEDSNENIISNKEVKKTIKTFDVSFDKQIMNEEEKKLETQKVTMRIPTISLFNIPYMSINEINYSFYTEIKHQSLAPNESIKSTQSQLGPNDSTTILGSLTSSNYTLRDTNKGASYHIEVKAKECERPEGLSRLLDILSTIPYITTETNNES